MSQVPDVVDWFGAELPQLAPSQPTLTGASVDSWEDLLSMDTHEEELEEELEEEPVTVTHLGPENRGYQMLRMLGWKGEFTEEGYSAGLGKSGQGRTLPVQLTLPPFDGLYRHLCPSCQADCVNSLGKCGNCDYRLGTVQYNCACSPHEKAQWRAVKHSEFLDEAQTRPNHRRFASCGTCPIKPVMFVTAASPEKAARVGSPLESMSRDLLGVLMMEN